MKLQLIILLLSSIKTVFAVSAKPKLLLVSYDGFRYDYFYRNVTPFMNRMKQDGTDVDYIRSSFVTKTFPNHHSMATGLYIESHGVLENRMFTPEGKLLNQSDIFHYNKSILPIWAVNEKNGGRTGTMMWPGSEFEYDGIRSSYAAPWNRTVSWESRAKELISLFAHPTKPINLGILYVEEPDEHAHAFGTEHPVINNVLAKLDNFTKFIHDQLEELHLTDVNVIHVSDHGMLDVNVSSIINITNLVGFDDCRHFSSANTIFINPDKGKETIVYEKLKAVAENTSAFDVYRSEDIPERYHYANNKRMTPIFIIARSGFAFETLTDYLPIYERHFNITISNQSILGSHGYDNLDPQMRAMFFARGPAFENNCKLEPFNNVDLFSLFCHILGIECPPTNGTLASFEKCLKTSDNSTYYDGRSILIIAIGVGAVIVAIYASIVAVRYRKNRITRNHYAIVL